MKQRLLMVCMLLIYTGAWAQNGAIIGKVLDEKGRPAIGAVVQVLEGGIVKSGALVFEDDGGYLIKPLSAGRYNVKVSWVGYKDAIMTGVLVSPDKQTEVNIKLEPSSASLSEVVIRAYKVPIVNKYQPGSTTTLTAEQIEKLPTRNSGDMISVAGGTYQSKHGRDISIAGARSEGAYYSTAAPVAAAPVYSAGRLTSGEVSDFKKWKLWEDASFSELKQWKDIWGILPQYRYTVQLKNNRQMPVVNATVQLLDRTTKQILWESRTDNTGKAELWKDIFTANGNSKLGATVFYEGRTYSIKELKTFDKGLNLLELPETECPSANQLDIAFIVDATGSMQDEINYLKAELYDIIQKVKDSMSQLSVRTGSVFYRDKGDVYLTKHSALNSNLETTLGFIRDNNADGGGDGPEAVEYALETALNELKWSSGATKLAFLILDAPPHADKTTVGRIKALTLKYAQQGIRLIPVACSGADKSTEYLMRSMALATNGTYLFLTNHSGIGGSHIEPSTDKYDVQYINQLICNVIYQFSYVPECKPQVSPKADTSYIVKVQSDTLKKGTLATKTDKQSEEASISWKYYPNPTSGKIYLEYSGIAGSFYISDVSGKLIMQLQASKTGRTEIDMAAYPSGIYFIKYQHAPEKWLSGKFSVVH